MVRRGPSTFQNEARASGNNPSDSLAALRAVLNGGFGDRLLAFEFATAITFIRVGGHMALLMVADVAAGCEAPVKISVHDPFGLLVRSSDDHCDVVLRK